MSRDFFHPLQQRRVHNRDKQKPENKKDSCLPVHPEKHQDDERYIWYRTKQKQKPCDEKFQRMDQMRQHGQQKPRSQGKNHSSCHPPDRDQHCGKEYRTHQLLFHGLQNLQRSRKDHVVVHPGGCCLPDTEQNRKKTGPFQPVVPCFHAAVFSAISSRNPIKLEMSSMGSFFANAFCICRITSVALSCSPRSS